jgi:probable rRNA maturation factor
MAGNPSPDIAVIRDVAVPSELRDDAIHELVEFALERERSEKEWQISIAFVDAEAISRLHEQFMGLSGPTDILTFADEINGTSTGDIAICVPVAAEQALELGHPLTDELAYLMLHGILHLLGYEDQQAHNRDRMLARQDELLAEWRQSRL